MNNPISRAMPSSLIAVCIALALSLPATVGFADDGHDHGPPTATAPLRQLPRYTTQSELFEAVGELRSGQLVIWVDRTSSNEPLLNALVELESTGVRQKGTFEPGLGEYHFDGKPFEKPGSYPITLTIRLGAESDLLTGSLDVQAPQAATDGHVHGIAAWHWVAIAAAGALGATLFIGLQMRRSALRRRSSSISVGGAA